MGNRRIFCFLFLVHLTIVQPEKRLHARRLSAHNSTERFRPNDTETEINGKRNSRSGNSWKGSGDCFLPSSHLTNYSDNNSTFKNIAKSRLRMVNSTGNDTAAVSTDGLVTLSEYKLSRFVLLQVIAPVICLVGIIGNSIGLIGLHHQPLKSAFRTYLTALTSVDIVLLVGAFVKFILVTIARTMQELSALETYTELYLALIFGSCSHRISATLISIIAVERFLSVVVPFKVKTFAIEKRPRLVVIGSIVLQVIVQLPSIFMYKVESIERETANKTIYVIAKHYNTDTVETFRKIHLIVITVIGILLPLLVVSISTTGIIILTRNRSTSLPVASINVMRKQMKRERMNATLIGMSVAFTISTLSITVVYMLSAFNATFKATQSNLLGVIVDVNTVLICINSADDFVIYFLASESFRYWFLHVKCRCLTSCSKDFVTDDVRYAGDTASTSSPTVSHVNERFSSIQLSENNVGLELFGE